jgi:hypothetical protein
MKLKYKILWVEDEEVSIKIKAKNIRRYLENDYGFECGQNDIVVLNYEEFLNTYVQDNEIKTQSNIEQFDIFLVDFDLGKKEHTGDKLIQIIRDSNIYSEILFYSSDLPSLTNKLQNQFIDGVFTSVREELEGKIKKLIKVTIKKVQDVNNLRGLIMAEVAELDRLKKDIVKKYIQINPNHNDLKKHIRDRIFENFGEDNFNLSAQDDSYQDIELEDLIENLIYDSYKKARTVHKINNDFTLENYNKEIIKKRNVFAHEKEQVKDDGTQFLKYPDGKELDFSEEHCIQIRKDIQKYKAILEKVFIGL